MRRLPSCCSGFLLPTIVVFRKTGFALFRSEALPLSGRAPFSRLSLLRPPWTWLHELGSETYPRQIGAIGRGAEKLGLDHRRQTTHHLGMVGSKSGISAKLVLLHLPGTR